ncbi:hypothetical protein WR25_25311 [Diploscapter pachys]|uniref:Uncharacterized protein n=1 Tax=Diploscapter pachys TaxID=2018661 RepID=A0A2A2JEU1_9BILA|nr:hypothetical protein WR25_25311 [Diploscapter pachys]
MVCQPGLDGLDVPLDPEPSFPCVLCPAGPPGNRGLLLSFLITTIILFLVPLAKLEGQAFRKTRKTQVYKDLKALLEKPDLKESKDRQGESGGHCPSSCGIQDIVAPSVTELDTRENETPGKASSDGWNGYGKR